MLTCLRCATASPADASFFCIECGQPVGAPDAGARECCLPSGEGLRVLEEVDDATWNHAAPPRPDRAACRPAGPAETSPRCVGSPSRQQKGKPGVEPCCPVL